MKYANGKEALVGDTIVGRDSGGNIVTGAVIGFHRDGKSLRVTSVPLLVEAAKSARTEDALDAVTAANRGMPQPAAPDPKVFAAVNPTATLPPDGSPEAEPPKS